MIVTYLFKLPFYVFEWYWIYYVYNSDKRGVQIILFGYVLDFEWHRDVFEYGGLGWD